MPFDIDPKFIETKPDLSKPSLEGLSWLLRHPEAWPAHFQWRFQDVLERGKCGTTGCAIGIAQLTWGGMLRKENRSAASHDTEPARERFGMRYDDFADIFLGASAYPSARLTLANISPAMVADAIDAYLAQAIDTEGQDPQGLGAKPESAVAIGDAPGGLSDV